MKGKVRAFTEAMKGEKDGMVLGDGTVVHWPPHLADRFSAVAKWGDRVEVAGRYESLPEGEKVFEARTLTNLTTKASFTNDDGPPPKGRKGKSKKDKDDAPPAGKGGPGDLDRRVRTLERKIDRLTEDLNRSRGEKLKSAPRQE